MKPLAGGAIEDGSLAMRFAAKNPAVSVIIPGMADVSEIEENSAAICNGEPLSDEELQKIAAIKDELGTNFCRRCNYCAPCPQGISISAIFLLEGYYSRYDLKDWAKMRYANLDKVASDCIECGTCESRCPYNLPIRQMLKKAKEVLGK